MKTIGFKVTDEEYELIEKVAREKNMSVAQFVKSVVLAYVKAKASKLAKAEKTEENEQKNIVEELKKKVEELEKRVSNIEQAINKLGDELEKTAKKAGLI